MPDSNRNSDTEGEVSHGIQTSQSSTGIPDSNRATPEPDAEENAPLNTPADDEISQTKDGVENRYKSKNFLVKFLSLTGDKTQIVGSLQVHACGTEDANSNTGTDAASTDRKKNAGPGVFNFPELSSKTLRDLRPLIPTMSRSGVFHVFCLPDRTPVSDSMPFWGYVEFATSESVGSEKKPGGIINITFTNAPTRFQGAGAAREALDKLGVGVFNDEPGTSPVIDKSIQSRDSLKSHLLSSSELLSTDPDATTLAAKPDRAYEQTEKDWRRILKNCNSLHGWYMDPRTGEIKMAPKQAFVLRPNLNMGVSAVPTQAELSEDASTTEDGANAIPTYRVQDDSKIEVESVDTAKTESFVKNNFANNSLDSNVSGGFGGFGAAVSVASKWGDQDEKGGATKTFARKIIGKYMLRRLTLVLRPGDLKATEEMLKAAKRVEEKDSDVAREFYEEFGQFFAHEISIGGALTSSRIIDSADKTEEERHKEDFKLAMGCSISAPFGFEAEGKYQRQTGEGSENFKNNHRTQDRVSFEAVGGNTLLAYSPQHWCASVSQSDNWRVIERSDVKRITESMATCSSSDLRLAQSWFSATEPTVLGNGIVVPPSHELHVQVRLAATATAEYLIHEVKSPITISVHQIMTVFPTEMSASIDYKKDLFPAEFQGPRVSHFQQSWAPGDNIWVFCARNDGKLLDGSKVVVRTGHNLDNRYLTIIRTRESVFVPCISTSGYEPIWTVREAPVAGEELPDTPTGEALKDGDPLCLTFDFGDNHRGFRDFVGDDLGHRRRAYPKQTNNRLVMVRQHNPASDNSVLLMSDEKRGEGVSRTLDIDGTKVEVGIVGFYMDVVANDGGDERADILLMKPSVIEDRDEKRRDELRQSGVGY